MEKYESLGLVGEGSYGIVIKCRNRETGRIVAVKKFLESEDDKTVKKIALREIRLLRQLRHENLVNLLEVWKQKRRWYLVFEFVEHTILDELEQFPCGLELSSARFYLYQIVRAVAFCHQHNIIHRDIKPENILVSQQGVIKLCDFGFARAMSAMPGESYTDYVATRWYRAPELLVGDTKYNKAVDVWAIGCLFVEMMTGMPLFPGDSDLDQLYHIIGCFSSLTLRQQEMFCRNPIFCGVSLPEPAHREPLHKRFPQLTGNAANFIQKCLQMDPERRPPCVQLLNHDLFTSDGFHIWFTLAKECNSPQRDVKTCYAITERGKPDPSTEKRITGHKDPGPHDPNMVEGRAAQEGYCGVMPDAGSLANQEGRSSVLREGRGRALQEGSGELTPPPMTNKTTLEDPHKPRQTGTTASRPTEMHPRNCPGAGIPSIPRIMSTAPALVPISLRCTDTLKRHVEFKNFSQQSMSSHISEARTGQQRAAEHSMGPVRSSHCKWNAAENAGKKKGDVRFPELRNTLLPQHRAEGKHRKKKTRIPSVISGDLHPCRNVNVCHMYQH